MKNANWPQLKSILMNRNQIGMRKPLLKSRKWENYSCWVY